MSKKWSVEKSRQNKQEISKEEKKKWSVKDADLSKYDFGVDEEYINSFLKDSQSYLTSQSNRTNSYKSGVTAYDDFRNSSTRKDLDTRASNIKAYLNANRRNLDTDAYNSTISYITDYNSANRNLSKSFSDTQKYYSQWKSEDDYNFSIKNNDNTLKYSKMSIADLKKEKEEYDNLKKKVNFSKYSQALASTGNPQGEAVSKLILGLMDKKSENKDDTFDKWENEYKDKGVLYYDSNGNAVTYDSLIRDKEHDQMFEEISGNAAKQSAYDKAVEAKKKILELDEKYKSLQNQKVIYKTNGLAPDSIVAEEQSILDAIKSQEAVIEEFNNLGYDFEELQYYNQMKEDREADIKKAEEAQKYAEEHELKATFKSMASTPLMIGEYVKNLVDTAQYGYANVYDDKYTNQSHVYQSTVANIIDDAVVNGTNSKLAGWLASTAYSGVTSAAQSALIGAVGTVISGGNIAVGTGAAMAIMGTQAASSSFNTSVRNGSTSGEAVSFSLASGIGEALFERLPLENMFKLAKGVGKTATKEGVVTLLKGLAKQSVIEGLEEGGTELWNTMADAIINGDHSAYNIAVDKYINQGYSESDAKKMAATDWVNELITSMVGGFIGGAVSGGAVGVPSFAINQGIQNAQYDAVGNKTIQNQNVPDLVADAQSLITEGEKSALTKLANKVAGVENVDNLSKREAKKYTRNVGKLVTEVADTKVNSVKSAYSEAIKHELESNGVENVAEATDVVIKKMSGQELTTAETKLFESVDGNTIVESVKKHEVKNAVDKENLQRVEESLNKTVEMVTTKNKSVQHQEMVEESGYKTTEGKTTVDATGVEVDSMIIESLDGDDVSLKVNMGEDSQIVSAGELTLNDNYAVMIEGLKRVGKKFNLNTSSANKLLALYESYNGDAFTFYKAMEAGISYGHYNIREYFDNNTFVKELSQEYQEKLYEIGRENAQTTAEESQASVELERKANAESKVTFTEDVKYHKLNKSKKAQVDFAITIAKTLGFDLEIFRSPKNAQGKSIGENGSYSASRNLMRLDIDAGTLDGKSLILFTQGHELTHFIKAWSPVKYKVFADFIMEHYAKSDVPVQRLIEQKIEQSKISAAMDKTGKHHVLTESEAFDEIVANACEDFLADPNIQQTILMIAEVDQSIAQKIKNFIKNLVARLEKAIRGLQGQSLEAGFVRELDLDAIQELKDLWTEALLDARESVIEARENVAPEVQEVIEEFGEDLGNVEYNEDGEVTLISSEDDNTQVYSERTWLNGGKEALIAALTRNEHTQEEINDTIKMVEDTLDYLKILAAGDAQMRGYTELANNLVADITTDIKGKKQVLHAIVNNGDYPVNIDLALICKKRVAYMNVMTRLIADGVMENVKYDGDAIAEVNAILRKNGFETACLGCFVESRRLQFQTWAETIVQEWNGEVDKRNKNAGSFNYTKNALTDASSLTDEELNKLDKELSGKKKNKQGNLNLGQGSAITRMGKLLDSAPTLQKHISVADLLTPEGLTKLRAENPNLFSIVKSRYGAATPKIVQKYNPYASELANLTFKSVSDITTNSVKGSQEYLKVAEKELASSKPALPKGMKKGEFNKTQEMKDWNAKVATLAMRKYLYDIGGARMQSFSDFMIENVFDYMQIFADLSANKFPLHVYTKEIAFLRLFGMTGAKINGSLIAHVDKSLGKRYAGLMPADEAKKGNAILVHTEDGDFAIGFDDYSRHMATKGTKGETFIQSIGMKDIIALQLDKRYSNYGGSITIGVSDIQILAMLDSPLFRMVIPYHASGMLPQFAQLVGVDMYNDYTNYQNTTVKQYYDLNKMPLPDETNDKGETKLGTLKKANGKSINADTSYNFNAELQKIGDPKTVANNYIAWCNEFHEVYDGKTLVGYAKFTPKFSNSLYGTDFTKHENYYKLLEDFNVYDGITEQYAAQGAVQMIFPSADNRLSATEMEEYKQRLRDTGIFTEKEIEKYAKIADMTFEELLKAEVKNRIAYQDEQNPKWESTIKEIEDELKGKYSRVDKPFNAYSDDWQHQDRDSTGRELSPEQVEFFKDSKVRDAEGRLIPVYHGTPKGSTTVFDKSKTSKDNDMGQGIYFSTDSNDASEYMGKSRNRKLYSAYLNIRKPFIVSDSITMSIEDAKKLLLLCDDRIIASDVYRDLLTNAREGYITTGQFANTNISIYMSEMLEKSKKYDGIIDETVASKFDLEDGTKHIIAFNSNQIKETDNLNPTDNEDIRYQDRVIPTGIELPKDTKVDKNGKPRSAQAQRDAGYMLSESKFYQLYSVHKLTYSNRGGEINSVIEKIKKNGFISTTSNANVLPSSTMRYFHYDDNGKVEFSNIVQAKYAPRKDDYVIFVPNTYVTSNDIIKNGFKPLDYEIGIVEYDYQPYYEVYAKAYDQAYKAEQVIFNGQTLYQDRNYAPTFYSQMGKVIESVKQEKLGASSVIPMLKGKGIKNEEIKWSGIETFLEGKKSVTKQELLDFVAGSQLQIIEQVSGEDIDLRYDSSKQAYNLYDSDGKVIDTFTYNEFIGGYVADSDEEIYSDANELRESLIDAYGMSSAPKWAEYKLNGGSKYREIVFQLPNSSYSNNAMKVHWGEDAEGVLAHARIQDFIVDGKKMLFVEEIQSDWHNEGATKGYYSDNRVEELHQIYKQMGKALHDFDNPNHMQEASKLREKYHDLEEKLKSEGLNAESIPDAPFSKTYHEYVLKRLLRMAAEEGYDSIGWTTSDIQSNRYSDEFAEGYRIEYDQDIPKFLNKYGKKWGAKVGTSYVSDGTEVWSMDITDSMKNSVLYEGQALFQDRVYQPSLEELGLRRENENLKADVENLKEMLKLQSTVTHGKVLAKAKYKDIAKKLLHEFGMKQVKDQDLLNGFVQRLDEYFTGIINSDELTWEYVMEGAYKVAKWVDFEMPTETRPKYEYAEEILKDIRGKGVVLDDFQKAEVAYRYGSYNAFRKSLFGTINFVNKGTSLDSQWQEWSSSYPNIFDPKVTTNDMPIVLAEIISDMKETETVLNEEEQVQRVEWMASQIYDAYWLMPTVKTLADKHQKEVNLLKGKHREQMDALREKQKARETKTKEYYQDVLQKVREHKDAQLNAYKEQVKEQRISERDRKNRTVMKNRIKGVVKELNAILNRGTKDRNVKIPIQPAVAKALELAEYLFDDDLSNNFILTKADINIREEEKSDVEKYRNLSKLRDKYMDDMLSIIEKEGTESKVAELKDTISKLEAQMAYREKKLASLITNEKKKLQEGGIGEAVKALADAYAQLKKSEDEYIKNTYDDGVYEFIKGLADKLKGAKIKEMSADQMYDVYNVFKLVMTTVRDANKLFINGRREDVQQMSSNIMMQISANKKTKTVPYEKLDTLKGKLLTYTWNELKPYYAFQRIGSSTLMKLYEAARQGEDVLGRDYKEAIEFAERIKTKYGYDSWDMNKRYDIKLEDGRTFSVTLQEIMSIYAYSKREQAYDHMMFGGFVFNDKKFFKSNEGFVKGLVKPKTFRSTDAEAYRLSLEDIGKISKIIDGVNGLKGFVDEMQSYLSTDMAEKGNEISRVLYGVDWFNEKNYFPIKSSRDFLAIVNNPSENYSLRNSGMTKSTVPHAKNPLVLEDFMSVWAEHVGKMSTYHSLVIPIDNLNKVLSYKEASTSMKTVLDSVFGKSAKEYLDNFLKDLNGGVSSQGAKSPVASMFGKFKKTAVAASSSVVIQQPTAILRAMSEIDAKYFVKILAQNDKLKHNEKWELIKKYAPIAVIKELGGFDIGSGRKLETILTMPSYKGMGKVKGFVRDSQYRNEAADNAFMWGATKADEFGWNIIWSAAEIEIKDTTNLKSGTEEFYKKVGERFTEVVHKTQVYDSTFTRSGYQRSKSDLVQMAMSFMGEPTTSFNMLYDAILQSSRKNISKGKATRIIGATVTSIIFAAIAKSLIYALRDDDDDKSYLEKYVESTTENLVSDLFIPNMLPFVKDITSIISGWEVERTDMAIFTDIYKSFKQLDSDTVSDYRKVEDLIGSLASLFGVPAKNLLRTGREMRNVVKNIFDNNLPYGQGVADAVYRGLPFTQDKSKTDKLYNATVNGTQEYLDKFEGEDINTSLKKGLRDNDKRILNGVDALLDSDYTKYGSIVNQIVAEGKFSKEVVSGAIQSEANYFGGKIEEGAEALRDGNDKGYKDVVKELRDRYRGIYTQDEIIRMIKTYEFDTEEESDEEKSIYKMKYVEETLQKGDIDAATEMLEDIISTKIANGKTEEEARKSVRGTLTSYWKPLYQQALGDGDTYEQDDIRTSLYDMGVYGSYEEIDETLHGWKQNYVLETYRPQYIEAYQNGDKAEMRRIESKVKSLGVYKNAYQTVRGWVD